MKKRYPKYFDEIDADEVGAKPAAAADDDDGYGDDDFE